MTNITGLKAAGFGVIIAVAASFTTTVFAADAKSGHSDAVAVAVQEAVTKDAARKLVNDYLKAKKKRSQRVGRIKQKDNHWEIQILTRENFPVKTAIVNKTTGKLSFRKKRK